MASTYIHVNGGDVPNVTITKLLRDNGEPFYSVVIRVSRDEVLFILSDWEGVENFYGAFEKQFEIANKMP